MHRKDWEMVQAMGGYVASTYGVDVDALQPDFFLEAGDLKIGEFEMEVYHAPGHSPGSICLYWPAQKALLTGDVIFKEGLGRTDLPGGDGKQLKASIEHLSELDVTHLMPGHGEIISDRNAVKDNFEDLLRFYFSRL